MDELLFLQTCRELGITPTRAGDAHYPCPNCGHRVVPGQTHFHLRPQGGHCFVCGWGASLRRLRTILGLAAPAGRPPAAAAVSHRTAAARGNRQEVSGDAGPPAQRPHPAPHPDGAALQPPRRPPSAGWQRHTAALLDRYTRHPDRYRLWQRYRPLSPAAIDRWQLGVGVLPACRCPHPRLVYPIWDPAAPAAPVALRGRALSCDCGKVLQAAGSRAALFNAGGLRAGAPTVVCENPLDAVLLMDLAPDWVAVALGGVSLWRPAWAGTLRAARPGPLYVWLDNDLPGQAHGPFRRALAAAWWRERGTPPPPPAGPRLVRTLRRAGLEAYLVLWPPDAPQRADLGAWLIHLLAETTAHAA